MSSFDVVNYSLRPNKSIQRAIVFDGLRKLGEVIELKNARYIGFGSIWFTDFQKAHKELHLEEMISIEGDEVGFSRAQFNKPYRTVRIEKGLSGDVLPVLLSEEDLVGAPWIAWLDYDGGLDESVADDLQLLVERAPPNSVVLTTFNGSGQRKYGKPKDRPKLLKSVLGDVVPDDLKAEDCDDKHLPETLAVNVLAYMQSVGVAVARPGGFVPAFRLTYRDGASMTTVGGVLPQRGAVPAVRDIVSSPEWQGFVEQPITAPLLTVREAAALQAKLPGGRKLTRRVVQSLGFDLDDAQIQAFERYYRYYPSYAQVML
ncbi:O-methyltransferase [Parvibaculum sp.]|uniref:O-methyltransferase n=1 Tax=Parvibaculum sp. TaxID=2024848 RepID=UPI003BAD0ED7